ncbi:hypothetical protein BDZ89DRAFT_1149622 [Hymenopellis radicata]|nr:hypothetical protein BDZ89DRAFT_1149622 [Hymenopellis radicata]
MSQRPSGAVEERFVVNSGTAFGVEGYQDICYLAQKRKADKDVDMDADTEHVVEEMRKKHKVDKSPSRRNPRKATTASPSPAKGATPKSTPKPASRKSTLTPAPRKPNPRSQTSQRSAVAGPSASIPYWRETRR